MVGMDRTSSPSCRRYRMVVLPAASSPAHHNHAATGHTHVNGRTHGNPIHGGARRGGQALSTGHGARLLLSLRPLACKGRACPWYILRFNVWGVPSMRMRFSDLPDSASRTREKRPPMLNYCTRAPNACLPACIDHKRRSEYRELLHTRCRRTSTRSCIPWASAVPSLNLPVPAFAI